MKRLFVVLFAITSTVACAEREKPAPEEQPAPPTTQTGQASAPATMVPPPHGLMIKRPLTMNLNKAHGGDPAAASASASASASAATK